MTEIPNVEIARLVRKDALGEQFRRSVNLALAEGLLSATVRPTSLLAIQRGLGPLSIALIVQRQHHRPQRIEHSPLGHAVLSRGRSFGAVLWAWLRSRLKTEYHVPTSTT